MTNKQNIILASVLIVITGLLILNPSTIMSVQGQMYDYDYGYEKFQEKDSDVNIQKIRFVNNNINVNGIDITEIPHDGTTTDELQANEQGLNGAQNANRFGDLNLDKNLLNICANANVNEQIKIEPSDIPDTNLDLVVVNFVDNDVSILLRNGDGTFDPATPGTVGVGDNPIALTVGEFNGL